MLFLKMLLASLLDQIKTIGYSPTLNSFEKRKLVVFNQLNFLGLLSGLIISITGALDNQHLPPIATIVALSPTIISSLVLVLNHKKRYEEARLLYFILYPSLTSAVYGAGLNVGIELYFILYAVLAVFYMQQPRNAFICFVFSAGCYLAFFVVGFHYTYDLRTAFYPFYVFNHLFALGFLFFAVFWIKNQNTGFQLSILKKNRELHKTNLEIKAQRKELIQKANELTKLNNLKNKLFSVIAHDLKGPLYAQRNLFKSIYQYDIPGDELKLLVPELLNDMNYTISLMDNLLHWAKCQMQNEGIKPQPVNVSELIDSVTNLLRLQAEAKEIYLEKKLDKPVYVYADKDMIHLVLRNLLSNAIKFTPQRGNVKVSAKIETGFIEVSVEDTGLGMPPDVLEKLSQNNYYTTKGTANESGTGIGLMLCKEFLEKNGSRIHVKSDCGKGSTFSFALPACS